MAADALTRSTWTRATGRRDSRIKAAGLMLQGGEPIVADEAKDARAVRDLAEELERQMDNFTE